MWSSLSLLTFVRVNPKLKKLQFRTSIVLYCIKKQNKHMQLSTKKKENRFSTKEPFKGLRVKWQPKQNQFVASMRQTFITVCVKKKRKKNIKKHQAFYEIICIVDYDWENFPLE